LSVHVAHCIARAIEKDTQVDQEVITKMLKYLSNIKKEIKSLSLSESARAAIESFALYVRKLMGVDTSKPAITLLSGKKKGKVKYYVSDDVKGSNTIH
jgi:hypothetical protein